jgi:hypothetical protein
MKFSQIATKLLATTTLGIMFLFNLMGASISTFGFEGATGSELISGIPKLILAYIILLIIESPIIYILLRLLGLKKVGFQKKTNKGMNHESHESTVQNNNLEIAKDLRGQGVGLLITGPFFGIIMSVFIDLVIGGNDDSFWNSMQEVAGSLFWYFFAFLGLITVLPIVLKRFNESDALKKSLENQQQTTKLLQPANAPTDINPVIDVMSKITSTPPPGSSPPPVPTPAQPVQAPTPPNPAPPSDTPKPQS